jgi:HlyD family secretion protein
MRRRWWTRGLVFGGVLLILILLRVTLFRPALIPVTVYKVARGRVEDTVVNSRAGTVSSRLRAQMSPGVSGLVAEIPVVKGARVRRGQVLLRLDDSEYRAQVNLAARSLGAAKAASEQSCLGADQTGRDRVRAEALAKDNLLSPQGLEEARTKDEAAQAACRAGREQVKQAEAALEVARATLEKTTMVAPFDGVVLDVSAQVGEWITPSPPGIQLPTVIDLISPDSLYISAPIDESDVARVRGGLPARITMDAFRGRSFPGTVTYVSSFVEARQEQNRTLMVEAVFDPGARPENVVAGLSADLEVILASRDEVWRIPTYALLEGGRVLLVQEGRCRERSVQTGLHNWEFTEIVSGLEAGDEVVISLDRPEVKAGARVRVAGEGVR